MMAAPSGSAAQFPSRVFRAPALAKLDERGRRDVAAAGRIVTLAPGDILYRQGDPSDCFFVVLEGSLRLRARGRDFERHVPSGEILGDEAALAALPRTATATAAAASRVALVPIGVYRRSAERAGLDRAIERELRGMQRAAIRDNLMLLGLGYALGDRGMGELLDAARVVARRRGEPILDGSQPDREAFVVLSGMVQLQSEQGGRAEVRALALAGDIVTCSLLDALAATSAVALGPCHALGVPLPVLAALAARRPEVAARLRSVARPPAADVGDVFRLQTARALLAIDAEACVRCGQCAAACADRHGIARLVRRGEQVQVHSGGSPWTLLLPSACQHCKTPLCLSECPTGAIVRDADGTVRIRDALCTGCGACAKACPWDGVRMAPRSDGVAALLAVKCDQCRGFDAPACLEACPTDALLRFEPERTIDELASLAGKQSGEALARPSRTSALSVYVSAPLTIGVVGLGLMLRSELRPGGGLGLVLGVAAALSVLMLIAHAAFKRSSAARRLMRRTTTALVSLHSVAGAAGAGAAAAHGGLPLEPTLSSLLALTFFAASGLGLAGALLYAALPARLSRLEARASLPEDLAAEQKELVDRFHRALSGRSELVKAIASRFLAPYAARPWGGLLLAIRGRSLKGEARRVSARIQRLLEGRGQDRLAGLEQLVRLAVELRAIKARLALSALLRAFAPAHAVLAAVVLVLLALHVMAGVLA